MPIYEYLCEQCGHQFEALQRITEDPLQLCPNCQQMSLKRLVSAAGFRLKGGGWYETDFKNGDQKRNLAQSDSENGQHASNSQHESNSKNESSKNESKSESKNDGNTDATKSAARSETKTDTKALKSESKTDAQSESKKGGTHLGASKSSSTKSSSTKSSDTSN